MNNTILVVEDDEPILQAITFKLEKEGFVVEGATDGVIGIEKLRSQGPFSGVLLDLRMPKGDGFSFLETKQKDSAISEIPVIVFTNLSQQDYLKKALRYNIKGYLIKAHHSVQDMVEEVKKCLNEGKCTIDDLTTTL